MARKNVEIYMPDGALEAKIHQLLDDGWVIKNIQADVLTGAGFVLSAQKITPPRTRRAGQPLQPDGDPTQEPLFR